MSAGLDVGIVSDLYQAGFSCDGDPFIAERFYVVAEAANGRRWRHCHAMNGAVAGWCEETGEPSFRDVREECRAALGLLVSRINARLEAGGRLDLALWVEVDPAYGSQAYQDQGTGERRWLEERVEAAGDLA